MRKRIGSLFLDIASAVILGLGIAVLLLPLVLYLGLGADNDAYIEIAEWAGGKPNILFHLGLQRVFRVGFLLWPAFLIITGLALRWLLWRWLRVVSPSRVKEQTG